MPIDLDRVVGARFGDVTSEWTETDVILYHLGVGAGNPPTDPGQLEYVYEGSDLKVLPTFATIPPFASTLGVSAVPGVEVNLALLLHGEHEIELHRPTPIEARVSHASTIRNVYDKGKGALVNVETVTSDDRGPLFTNRAGLFIRGEGGFGGDAGPPSVEAGPTGDPDLVVESETLPQQAFLYRLSGDRNPLHADPAFAALSGFDRPILHGLCSFGIIMKAVVDHALSGRVDRVVGYQGRFTGVVFPGETIVTSIWNSKGQLALIAAVKERKTPVLTNASVSLG